MLGFRGRLVVTFPVVMSRVQSGASQGMMSSWQVTATNRQLKWSDRNCVSDGGGADVGNGAMDDAGEFVEDDGSGAGIEEGSGEVGAELFAC